MRGRGQGKESPRQAGAQKQRPMRSRLGPAEHRRPKGRGSRGCAFAVRAEPVVLIPLALAIFALGMAGGGFAPTAVGVAVVGVWAVLGGLLASKRLDFSGLTSRLGLALVVFTALAALQALSFGWASDDGAAFLDMTRTLLYLGVLALVGLAVRPGSAPSWLAGIGLGGAAIALMAVGSRLLGFGDDSTVASELPLAAERLSYPLGYWNGLGYLMAMTLSVLVWFAVAGRPRQSELAVAGSIPCVIAMFLTGSRGAFLAAIVGIALVIWTLPVRTRVFSAAAIAVPAWTIALVAVAARRDRLDAAADPGLWGIALALGLVILAALAVVGLRRLAARPLTPHLSRRTGLALAVASCVALIVAVALLGPESFTGSFRGETKGGDRGVAAGLTSSSDRLEFWESALGAFGDDPLRGTGAGGFPLHWNQTGAVSVAVRNAHSAPFEELAELGILGALAVLAVLCAPLAPLRRAWRGAGPATRSMLGPLAAILVAGTLAVLVDWTWDLPAAFVPYLVAFAVVCGSGLRRRKSGRGSLLVEERLAGYEPDPNPPRPAPALLGALTAAAAAVAIWAGAVLALSAVELDRASDSLAEGQLVDAAKSARSAAAIAPWNVEPVLRLAEIEFAGGNLGAARRRAEEAARMSPEDYRPWVVLTQIQKQANLAIVGYTVRLRRLSPDLIDPDDPLISGTGGFGGYPQTLMAGVSATQRPGR